MKYRGIKRSGVATVGRSTEDPASFVEAKYRAGWLELTVADDADQVVGEIHSMTDDGRRTWWVDRHV